MNGVKAAITNPSRLLSANKDVERFFAKIKVSTERFWNGTPCWEWQAAKEAKMGYGHITITNRTRYAHRVAYELLVGEIPKGLQICHRCDNPPCCNIEHFFLGTNLDNVRDKMDKGRHACGRGDRHGSRTKPQSVPRGDQHYSRTNPERLARGDRNGSRTKPESRPRGDRHSSRTKPQSVPRGDQHYSRTNPERLARGERHGMAKIKDENVSLIFELRRQGLTLDSIGQIVGLGQSQISRILRGQSRGNDRTKQG